MSPSDFAKRFTVKKGNVGKVDEAFAAPLLGPPEPTRQSSLIDDLTVPLVAAVNPALVPAWKRLPGPVKLAAVATVGAITYTVYRVLRHVSEQLYVLLDSAVDDYSHPITVQLAEWVKDNILPARPAPLLSAPVTQAYSDADPGRITDPLDLPSAPGSPQPSPPSQPVGAPQPSVRPQPQTGGKASLPSRLADRLTGRSQGLRVGRFTPDEQIAIERVQAAGGSFSGGKGLTDSMKRMIERVAVQEGVPADHLIGMAQMESGGNPNAVSATGAVGLYQFTSRTGRSYGLTNRFDPEANTRAAAKLYKDNAAYLIKKKLPATLQNVYLIHQLGPRATQLITAAAKGEDVTDAALLQAMSHNYGKLSATEYIQANERKIMKAHATAQKLTAPENTYSVQGSGTSTPVQQQATPAPAQPKPKPKQAPVASPVPAAVSNRSQQAAPIQTPQSPSVLRTPSGLLVQVPN